MSHAYSGTCAMHGLDLPCRTCGTAAQVPVVPNPYGAPPLAAPLTVVTTRQVPIPCAVCEKRGWRPTPFEEDNPEDDGQACDACAGKGWLWVTETTTTRA